MYREDSMMRINNNKLGIETAEEKILQLSTRKTKDAHELAYQEQIRHTGLENLKAAQQSLKKFSGRRQAVIILIVALLMYALANGILMIASSYATENDTRANQVREAIPSNAFIPVRTSVADPTRNAGTNTAVAEVFGLESGKAYPMLVGGQFGATVGSIDTQGGLFYSSSSIDLSPATFISVGYRYDGVSYILKIDSSKTKIIEKVSAEPSVAIFLKDTTSAHAVYAQTFTEPRLEFRNLFFQMIRGELVSEQLVINPAMRDQNLNEYIDTYFERAEITLPPEMYERLVTGG